MARVTAEDCLLKVANKFELVLLASRVAKKIVSGVPYDIEADNKPHVVALRIIAEGIADKDLLDEELIQSQQTKSFIDKNEEENLYQDSELDYSPDNADIHISEDHSDLEDQMFADDITDEDLD